jgi:hypothetical protein
VIKKHVQQANFDCGQFGQRLDHMSRDQMKSALHLRQDDGPLNPRHFHRNRALNPSKMAIKRG